MDAPVHESIELPTAEPTVLISEEGVVPIVKELLPPESMAPKVEVSIPPVSPEVTFLMYGNRA